MKNLHLMDIFRLQIVELLVIGLLEKVQSVEMKDEIVKGTITVKKLGEVLENAIKDKSTDGNYHFQYKERALPGMVFEVRAAEDIKTSRWYK